MLNLPELQNAHGLALRRPLVPMSAALAILGFDRPEQVLDLVDDGRLSFAWNIGVRREGKREYRIWAGSLSEFVSGQAGSADSSDREVFAAIFPDHVDEPAIPAAVVARTWCCSSDLVLNLCRNRILNVLVGCRWTRGPGGSPRIQTSSVASFLKSRRL